uniref:Uncharacterized protein n=1 Tax=Musca domestica TaxID=7370 RepID=A0A1I8MVZ5_MUSDO
MFIFDGGPKEATGFTMKFTNLECVSLNESVAVFEQCDLKPTPQGAIGLNVHTKLLQALTNIKLQIEATLYKKANGYKPFLFDLSVDFCEMMAKKTPNIVTNIVMNVIKEYSNLNHTCPYDDDIFVENLVMKEDKFKYIPLPSADFMLNLFIGTQIDRIVGLKNLILGVDIKLTNLECKSLNDSVVQFSECRLKLIRRGVVGMNISVKVLQPLPDIFMEMGFFKKANGYKPFLYNQTVDLCKLLSKSNHNMVAKILLNVMSGYTNLNHSCPYKEDIVVKNLVLTDTKFKLFPLPTGEYMQLLFMGTHGKRNVQIHMENRGSRTIISRFVASPNVWRIRLLESFFDVNVFLIYVNYSLKGVFN